jgi:hypothetical protein
MMIENKEVRLVRILFALLSMLFGLALVFGGYRLARFLIPLAGFIVGLSIGGNVISAMNGTPFLGAALGIIVGVVLGLVFALLSYLFYSVAVVLLFGSLGYWIGSSFILLFGFDPGFISTVVGLVLGVVFGLVALAFNAPKYFLIVFTGLTGAVVTIGGIMLLLNKIPIDYFSYSSAKTVITSSFIWTILALVLAGVGMAVQAISTPDYDFATWNVIEEGEGAKPTKPAAPAAA